MNQLPSIRNMEAFIMITKTRSVREAAERLHLTVAAISRRIHSLENQIGAKLFHRSGREINLTSVGRRYRDSLFPAMIALRTACDAVHAPLVSASLRISAPEILLFSWLLPNLSQFTQICPGIRIELLTCTGREGGEADVIFRIQTGVDGTGRVLGKTALRPVCHPDLHLRYDLGAKTCVLAAPRFVIRGVEDPWPAWAAAAGLLLAEDAQILTTNSAAIAYRGALLGLGLTMSTNFLSRADVASESLIYPFDTVITYDRVVSVESNAGAENRIVGAFFAWLDTLDFESQILDAVLGWRRE